MYETIIRKIADSLEFEQVIRDDVPIMLTSDAERVKAVFGEPDYYGFHKDELIAIYLLGADALFYLRDMQDLASRGYMIIISRGRWIRKLAAGEASLDPVVIIAGVRYSFIPAMISHFLREGTWPL